MQSSVNSEFPRFKCDRIKTPDREKHKNRLLQVADETFGSVGESCRLDSRVPRVFEKYCSRKFARPGPN